MEIHSALKNSARAGLLTPVNAAKNLSKRTLQRALARFYIRKFSHPQEELASGDVQNIRVLHPAERITFASPDTDAFVPIAKYYPEGWLDRPDIYVCDIPDANFHVKSGLVCTRSFGGLVELGREVRMFDYPPFGRLRPLAVKRLRGTYSSINYAYAGNFWHWMVDCLPKMYMLAKVAPRTGFTLLMPASSNEYQRETIRAVIPGHFKLNYLSGPDWVRTDLFLWPSLLAPRAVGTLPQEYYDAIREAVFRQYNLPRQHTKKERIYISREGAKHRRVINEDAVMQMLEKYGFRKILLEKMPFREQVELFHRAEIVIGPHGAGWGATFFSGDIDVVVLYSTPNPPNYFHTMALGLGQKHHFVCHTEGDDNAHFVVNVPELERVLKDEVGLK